LLESAGYRVVVARHDEVLACLEQEAFQLLLATTDDGVQAALSVCATVKERWPDIKIAVVARRAEYIPEKICVDDIIRVQYTPGKFLARVKRLMDAAGGQSLPASSAK